MEGIKFIAGFGKLKPDSKQYELATFSAVKKYNCDLNASYNICAGLLHVQPL